MSLAPRSHLRGLSTVAVYRNGLGLHFTLKEMHQTLSVYINFDLKQLYEVLFGLD